MGKQLDIVNWSANHSDARHSDSDNHFKSTQSLDTTYNLFPINRETNLHSYINQIDNSAVTAEINQSS